MKQTANIIGDADIRPLLDAGFGIELQFEDACTIVSLCKGDVAIVILGHHIDVCHPGADGEQEIRVFPGDSAMPDAIAFALTLETAS